MERFMKQNKFKLMNKVSMVEIFLVAFIKESKLHMVNGVISTNTKACGLIGPVKFGNKGGV